MSQPIPPAHGVEPLTDHEIALLDFEKSWWTGAGAKSAEIRARFAMSPAQYYRQLNALLDRPEALRHDPLLVKRLLRVREARQRQRSAVRLPRR